MYFPYFLVDEVRAAAEAQLSVALEQQYVRGTNVSMLHSSRWLKSALLQFDHLGWLYDGLMR